MLIEPAGRNTAAAIALATVAVDRPDDDVMIVLPADHFIRDEGVFRDVLRTAATRLATGALGADDALVTLGIHVSRPATEYGYLIPHLDAGPGDRRARRPIRSRVRGEARSPRAPRSCPSSLASHGTPACSCGAAGRSDRRSSGIRG